MVISKGKLRMLKTRRKDISAVKGRRSYPGRFAAPWEAWNNGNWGQDVNVALLDTGINNHHDLKGVRNLIYHNGTFVDSSRKNLSDSHGSQCAGIICAQGYLTGVAPKCNLIGYQITDLDGYYSTKLIVHAIEQAVKDKSKVINFSHAINADIGITKCIEAAIKEGCVFCCAADTDGVGKLSYPASLKLPGMISVGIASRKKEAIKYSPFIDIYAPGQQIFTTDTTPVPYDYIGSDTPSASAAFVSGTAALVIKEYIDTFNEFPNPKYIVDILTKSAQPLMFGGISYPNKLLNASKAVSLVRQR